MRADLHIHTFFSDGSLSPEDVVEKALQGRLDLIAITDHDTFSGYKGVVEVSANAITVLPGIEFSTFLENQEIHILGFFPSGVPDRVEAFAKDGCLERIERIKECLRNFEKLGIRIDFFELKRLVKGDVITRNHIANLLVDRGIVSSFNRAFSKYLNYENGIVPPLPIHSKRAIETIHQGGGKAVLAHPELSLFDTQVKNLVSMGLDGVEVYGRREEGIYTYYFERVAEDFRLFKTGGSDFHGHERNFSLGDFFVSGEKIREFLKSMRITEAD